MNKDLIPLYVGLIAAFVTAIGWIITNYLAKQKEDRVRQLEGTKNHLERQIEEFYGPLFNFVHQIVVCNHVQHEILYTKDSKGNSIKSAADADKVRQLFQDTYFIPLHDEMIRILKTRLYLIEGAEMPESFYKYLRHSIQEQVQGTLWRKHGVDTSHVRGLPYPNEIYQDVKRGLDSTMFKYEQCINNLKVESGKVETNIKEIRPADVR